MGTNQTTCLDYTIYSALRGSTFGLLWGAFGSAFESQRLYNPGIIYIYILHTSKNVLHTKSVYKISVIKWYNIWYKYIYNILTQAINAIQLK